MTITQKHNRQPIIKTVINAGLLAGLLDALGAIVMFLPVGGRNINRIFQYIASAVFGKEAFSGGVIMVVAGVLFHFFIACSFAITYFILYPKIKMFAKYPVLCGLLYGVFVWFVMNVLVLPLTKITTRPFQPKQVIIGMVILMLCVGLPISIIAKKYYVRHSI